VAKQGPVTNEDHETVREQDAFLAKEEVCRSRGCGTFLENPAGGFRSPKHAPEKRRIRKGPKRIHKRECPVGGNAGTGEYFKQ